MQRMMAYGIFTIVAHRQVSASLAICVCVCVVDYALLMSHQEDIPFGKHGETSIVWWSSRIIISDMQYSLVSKHQRARTWYTSPNSIFLSAAIGLYWFRGNTWSQCRAGTWFTLWLWIWFVKKDNCVRELKNSLGFICCDERIITREMTKADYHMNHMLYQQIGRKP